MLGLFLKGYLIGLSVAAPIGPVNIEIIRRGLGGRICSAFLVGMGAVTADSIYISLVCLGLAPIVQHKIVSAALLGFGACLLFFLSYSIMKRAIKMHKLENPKDSDLVVDTKSGRFSIFGSYLIGLGLCISSPLQIGLWMGIAADFSASGLPLSRLYPLLLFSVASGCTSWVIFITTILRYFKRLITARMFRAISFGAGIILTGYALYFLSRCVIILTRL